MNAADLPAELRVALGLDAGAEVAFVEGASLSDGLVGIAGFAGVGVTAAFTTLGRGSTAVGTLVKYAVLGGVAGAVGVALPLDTLRPALRHLPEINLSLPHSAPDLAVSTWRDLRGVFALSIRSSDVEAKAGVTSTLDDGRLLIDARAGRAAARLRDSKGGAIVVFEPERVLVFRVVDTVSDELAPPPWLRMYAVTPAADEAGMPWLDESIASLLARRDPFSVAAATGLAGRLAFPRDEVLPARDARRWFSTIGAAQRTAADRAACSLADALVRDLEELEHEVARSPERARTGALLWLHRRDDLRSFTWLSSRSEPGLEAAARCNHVDDEGLARLSMFMIVPGLVRDARLREVGKQEPETWWGNLAFPS